MSGVSQVIGSQFKKIIPDEGVVLKVDGVPYKNFISVTVNRSMDAMSGSFDFVATIDSFKKFPIKLQDEVVVEINGTTVITGFIEVVEPSYTTDTHQIRLSGRDKTGDVIDSSVIESVSFKERQLRNVIFKLLENNKIPVKNIRSIQAGTKANEGVIGIIDLAEPEKFNENAIQGAVVGENLFEVIDKYCMKRQVLASTDGFGNIVLTRASKKILEINGNEVKLIHKDITQQASLIEGVSGTTILTRQNNILSASSRYSTENRFNLYIVKSQKNPNEFNGTSFVPSSSIVDQSGSANDLGIGTSKEAIRASRSLVISADNANVKKTADKRADWEANVRRARSQTYTCTVQGFSIKEGSNEIWQTNRLVQVEDDKTDINGELLIRSVLYSFSLEGSKTTMELISPDSFTPEPNQTSLKAKTNKLGPNT